MDRIKEKYLSMVTNDHQWSLNKVYVDAFELVRIYTIAIGRKRRSNYKHNQQAHSIVYSDLFKIGKNEQPVKKILIEGESGIGKTTLCTTIVKKWASGEIFSQFELVLMLPLHLEEVASATSIRSLFNHLHYLPDDKTRTSVVKYMRRHSDKVLIIADGWDDVGEPDCFLYLLLLGELYGSLSVLITARSASSFQLRRLSYIDRCFELHGFNKSTVRLIVQYEFDDDKETVDFLLQQLESNPLIESVSSIPLIFTIICHISRELKEEFPTTMTELYEKIILYIINLSIKQTNVCDVTGLSVSSYDDLPEDLKQLWRSLCEIAFRNIQNSEIEASSDLASLSNSHLGLIKSVMRIGDKVSFHFLHSAIESYLAAFHLVHQPSDIQLQVFQSQGKLKHLALVWRLFFGVYFSDTISIDFKFGVINQCIQTLASFISSNELYRLCHYSLEAKSKAVNDEVVKCLSTTKRKYPSPASVLTIHFGNPCIAYDCTAVLYVISNIEQNCNIQINFRDCCLRDKQICEMADVLASKHDKLRLKALDLSGNKVAMADLFSKAANVFKFTEILLLRNCDIGLKGTEVILNVISNVSQNMMKLDLSYNTVSVLSFKDALLSCALSNLEVLFLKGSLTTGEGEDIETCFPDFCEALSSHCEYLRRLDLSDNDLGNHENLRGIISQLMGFGKNAKLDLCLDEKYMSEVQKNFITIMEESMKKKGTIDHTVVHGVIVGPGRSGKNSLMERLMGEGPRDCGIPSASTGVLENVFKVEVKKLCTVAAAANSIQWSKLEYNDEALELMMTTARSYDANASKDDDHKMTASHSEKALACGGRNESNSFSEGGPQVMSSPPKKMKLVKHHKVLDPSVRRKQKKGGGENVYVYSSDERRTSMFERAFKLRYMSGLREQLESSWSLYLTNTGGQIEFQELFPLLVCGPSVFFITFPLNRDFQQHYTVEYQYSNGAIEKYPSPTTLLEEILQTLATISTLECVGHKDVVIPKPKIFFVGTHKDLLPEPSREEIIARVDNQLQVYIKETSLFYQGSIEYASPPERLIFTVDNLSKDDEDFQNIRSALQLAVERTKDFTIQCPSSWLVFSLVLRTKYKTSQVLSYKECFTIARSCGITDRAELNNALFFIHTRLGLIRYFSVNGLNSLVVIDPQILFDKITDLIVNTFVKEHATVNEIEEFQNRGILSKAVMERISGKTGQNNCMTKIPFDWLLKLLNYLRIAAYFRDDGGDKYFFPAVLCRAPEPQSSSSIVPSNAPPPLLIAFESGFCPRGIPGSMMTYLMTNEMKSKLDWNLQSKKICRNQVTFGISTLGDVIIKIKPTHLVIELDPKCDRSKVKSTCREACIQIEQCMKTITTCNQKDYFFGFYCTRSECSANCHAAKIEWHDSNPVQLECKYTCERSKLPEGYQTWLDQEGGCSPTLKGSQTFHLHPPPPSPLKEYTQCHVYHVVSKDLSITNTTKNICNSEDDLHHAG